MVISAVWERDPFFQCLLQFCPGPVRDMSVNFGWDLWFQYQCLVREEYFQQLWWKFSFLVESESEIGLEIDDFGEKLDVSY